MGGLFIKAFVAYIEAHPEVVEKLVEWLIGEIVKHIESQPK